MCNSGYSSSQPFFSDFTKAFPFITAYFTDTSQLIALSTVNTSLGWVATLHAKEWQFTLLFLLLYLPLESMFLLPTIRARPLAQIRHGRFCCGFEHLPAN